MGLYKSARLLTARFYMRKIRHAIAVLLLRPLRNASNRQSIPALPNAPLLLHPHELRLQLLPHPQLLQPSQLLQPQPLLLQPHPELLL